MKRSLLLSLTLLLLPILFTPGVSLAEETTEQTTLGKVNSFFFSIMFFDISGGVFSAPELDESGNPVLDESGIPKQKTSPVPFLVAFLLCGAIFFTFWYRFINFKGFKHAIDIVRGKYDHEEDAGEISHFRALTSALSATVGLGNIAGVAVAIQIGGPGAVVWMIITALFGMSSKFNSCTLSQMYRKKNADGTISGGPMYYLDIGLRELGGLFAPLGKVLGILYALMVMGGSLGGGNMFQANQTVEAFTSTFELGENAPLIIGILMAVMVGVVILGGIRRIGLATSRIVPAMCGLYVLASLYIILAHISQLPAALGLIFSMAFSANAAFGGAVGVAIKGITRAAFSNEAGIGSAAIVHAAAKTEEPVREGLVAMLGPFIDTVIICLMTALVVIVTGVWNDPQLASATGNIGVSLTTEAFRTTIPWFPYVLTICIGLFAYSTMISWCYYGERGWIYLLDHFNGIGLKTVFIFRLLFVCFVVVGAVNELKDVLDFADIMILSMAFPNILGSILLARHIRRKLDDYWSRYESGAFEE